MISRGFLVVKEAYPSPSFAYYILSNKKQFKLQIIIDFFKAFDSIHREKMEQILLVYGLPKETVTAIMMLYKKEMKQRMTHLRKIQTSTLLLDFCKEIH